MKEGKGKTIRSNSSESPELHGDDDDEGLVAYLFKQPGAKPTVFGFFVLASALMVDLVVDL
jgi:hypothetical protein